MEKQSNICFYNKFVDEEKVASIENFKSRRSLYVSFFTFMQFCLIFGTLPTFFGYNFQHTFSTIMFCWNLFFTLIAILSMIKFLSLDKEFGVFKKKKYPLLFCLPFLILSIVMCILPIFTTKFIGYDNGAFEVEFNPAFFFFGFLPLYFGYLFFTYYAFLKCFVKYTREKK